MGCHGHDSEELLLGVRTVTERRQTVEGGQSEVSRRHRNVPCIRNGTHTAVI